MRRLREALLALALGGALAACTSSGGTPAPSPKATSSDSTSVHIPSQHPLPPASRIRNNVKLRTQVAITSCVSTPSGWKAAGRAVNSGRKPQSYNITVFFTTRHATVLDYARTKLTVPPGHTGKWTAAARFAAERTTLCVLRGVG
jgi:hypothetical protein